MNTHRNLCSVKKLPAKYPDSGITESSIRWLIFNKESNGFSECVLKMGRKVLIDLEKFEQWLDEQAMQGGNV